MNLQSVASIEHEHCIFATLAQGSTPPDRSSTVVSSLIVGEHFIHSYHFRFGWTMDRALFLILITYSKHDNTRFLKTQTSIHLVDATQAYLMVSCTL